MGWRSRVLRVAPTGELQVRGSASVGAVRKEPVEAVRPSPLAGSVVGWTVCALARAAREPVAECLRGGVPAGFEPPALLGCSRAGPVAR